MDFNSKKTKQIISIVLIAILILAMVLPVVAAALV